MEKIAEGFIKPIISSNPNTWTAEDTNRMVTGHDL